MEYDEGYWEPDDFEVYNQNEADDYRYDHIDDGDVYPEDEDEVWNCDDRPRRPCSFVCNDSEWVNGDVAPVDQLAICPHPSHWYD